MASSGLNILIDTGFWIALYNPEREPVRSALADQYAELIQDQNIIVPYPSLYEFVNSRLSRGEAKHAFKTFIGRPNVIKVSDSKYNEIALESFFSKAIGGRADVSLVDEILILMLEDTSLRIDYIASFDQGLINQAAALRVHLVK